jgi:hypothetical protein
MKFKRLQISSWINKEDKIGYGRERVDKRHRNPEKNQIEIL